MGAIASGLLKMALNLIFKGMNFSATEIEIIADFLALIFDRAFKSKVGSPSPKARAMNYMTRMIRLSQDATDDHLCMAFEKTENELIRLVGKG